MSLYESLKQGLTEAIEYEKGRISLRTNTISITEPEEFNAHDIKSIRLCTGLTQAAFASAMGVSKKTVEAWESGRNTPSGTAKRLLAIIEEDPRFFEREGIIEVSSDVSSTESIEVTVHNNEESRQVAWSSELPITSLIWQKQRSGGLAYGVGC